MAWRFKASKYKNSTPNVPKFENLIRDLSIGSYHSHGNYIESSAAFMAFNWDVQGSNLAVLPLDTKGRQTKASVPLIYAHSDFVTDFKFSPFDDGLLATGSNDTTIKLWRIPESGLTPDGLSEPELTLSSQPRRIETIDFHPTADNILATSSANFLAIWDLVKAQDLFTFADHGDEVQCTAWQPTGKLIATQCKDKKLRIIDPRTGNMAAETDSHEGIKDSKVVWMGDSQRLLTTGFSSDRSREIFIRDVRNLKSPQKQLSLDQSSGILIPLYDPDTNMCFLAGKGDRNIQFVEITNTDPFIVEGLKYSGDQTKGACLVPKRAMDVMNAEVNRVLQLCDSSVVPITWQVPRKSYRDYHADVYPETNGLESSMGPSDWFSGSDLSVKKIDLDPKKRLKERLVVFQDKPVSERPANKKVANIANGSANGKAPTNTEAENRNFAKPTPRPRVASKDFTANGDVSSFNAANRPVQDSSPVPSPRILPKNNSEDQTDDSLDFLRRQPSIRDRKKMFEEVIRQNQEPSKPAVASKPLSTTITNAREPPKVVDNVAKTVSKDIVMPKEKEIVVQKEKEKENEARDQIEELNFSQLRKKNSFLAKDSSSANETVAQPAQPKRPQSKIFGRVQKFKHLKGDVILKGRFENLKNLSKTMPAECNFVHANPDRIALPLTGPGGKVAIFEASKPGRIPDGVTPVLINGTGVMDFAFDPFDNERIVCACDDGQVRIWRIPSGGLVVPVNEPETVFSAHGEKVQLVKFHPTAKDVLMTAAFDRTVKIWNLNDVSGHQMALQGHSDQLFSAEWSRCGRFLATVCRDGRIRIFEPKTSGDYNPIVEGGEIVPKKGARVSWVLDNKYLVVTGFSKQSERQVSLFRAKDLSEMTTLAMDVSPTILRPFYDEDSSTLFLTGKGDSVVSTFEVAEDAPHFFPLSPYRPSGLHQGLAFLPKNVCDVKAVEFARAFRILDNSIEPVSFTVPRIKSTYFQDDLFPPTRVYWKATMTSDEFFSGVRKLAPLISLQPSDMQSLSESTGTSNNSNNNNANNFRASMASTTSRDSAPVTNLTASLRKSEAKQQATDIQDSVSKILQVDSRLEQDHMEGVEDKEWDD